MTTMNAAMQKALAELIATEVAKALAANKPAKGGKTPTTTLVDGKTERQLQLEVLTVRAFKKKGLKENQIKPRENVLTFNRWVEKGFRVKEGETAVKVKNLRLFHETQVRPLTDAEKAKIVADNAAAIAAHQAAQGEAQDNAAQPSA